MQKIAEINGKPVYSDKGDVSSIIGTRVSFQDGSWCDVSTGEVVNKGPGSISIGGSGSSGSAVEDTIDDVQEFEAEALDLRGLDADVDVQPWDGLTIRVTVSGPASETENVIREIQGSTLVIEGKNSSGGGSSITIGSGGIRVSGGGRVSSVIVGGGNVSIGSIGGGSEESSVKVKVELPASTPIRFSGLDGRVTIGDTGSPLKGKISGISSVHVGRVGSTDIKASGTGSFTASEVNGSLTVKVSGTGSVQVSGGQIDDLSVDVSGTGNANIGGTAQDADLDASGTGNITVAHVVNRPREHRGGLGSINVLRVG